MLPTVQGNILVYREGDQEGVLTIGTAAWFAWLETASTFSFVSDLGTFTARKERASTRRGGWYWKAYRKQHGKLSSRYLGKSETVTPVAWLSLEPEDNDPVRFLSYLIAALQRLDSHIGTAVLPLLQAPRRAPLERVMALVINDLMASAARDFALVLDDYHVITA